MIKIINERGSKGFTFSRIGENHINANIENQDSIGFENIGEAWYLAVADGVSSATMSKIGANYAIKVIENLCKALSTDNEMSNDLDSIRNYIVRKWKDEISSNWDEYATTLNFVIYSNHQLLIGQIGDGLIVADIDGIKKTYSNQEEFYFTETDALGKAVKRKAIRLEKLKTDKRILVYIASDGIGKEIIQDSRIDLCNYFEKMLEEDINKIQNEFEEWMISLNRKNGDDKTIGFVKWEDDLCKI